MKNPLGLTVRTEAVPLLLLIAAWVLGLYFYQHFPDRVASHWNFYGQPDRYGGKAGVAFGMPALLSGMYLLFTFLPLVDPKAERYAQFAKVYRMFRAGILLLLLWVLLVSGLFNLGYPIKVQYAVAWPVGLLLMFLGNYLGKVKPNWFVGIRTPWTLSSEDVWNKSNRFGGRVLVLFGLAVIVVPLLPMGLGIALFLGSAVLVVLGTTLYSYLLYRREVRQREGR